MTAHQELGDLLLNEGNRDIVVLPAAGLLRTICEEHTIKTGPLWKRALHAIAAPPYWGTAIFIPLLEDAGLIKMPANGFGFTRSVHSYVPTQKGLDMYGQLVSEGFYGK